MSQQALNAFRAKLARGEALRHEMARHLRAKSTAVGWAWTAVALCVLAIACGGRAVEGGSSAANGGASGAGAVAGTSGHQGGTGGAGGTGEGGTGGSGGISESGGTGGGGGMGGTGTGATSGSGGLAAGGSGGSAAAGGGIDAGSSLCGCLDADYALTLSDGTVLRYNQPSSDECGPTPLRADGFLGCGSFGLNFAACAGTNGELPRVTKSSDRLEYVDASGTVWEGYPSTDIADYGGNIPIDVTVEGHLSSNGRGTLFFSARLVACGSIRRLPC